MPDSHDYESRIARLEGMVSRMRLLGTLGAVVVLSAVAIGQAAPKDRVIQAEVFQALDSSGKVRGSFGVMPSGSTTLLMVAGDDDTTRCAVRAGLSAEGDPSLSLMKNGKVVFLAPSSGGTGSSPSPPGATRSPDRVRDWRTVREWSGKGPKQTESFEVGVKEWRVRWATTAEAGKGFGTLSIWVKDNEDGMVSLAANHQGIGSDVSYVRAPAGRFYLDVQSANANWTVSVEVPE